MCPMAEWEAKHHLTPFILLYTKPPSALSAKIFTSFFCRLNTIFTSASVLSFLSKERNCRQHVSPVLRCLWSTSESFTWRLQEACEGYRSGLFSCLTDKQRLCQWAQMQYLPELGRSHTWLKWQESGNWLKQESTYRTRGLKFPNFLNLWLASKIKWNKTRDQFTLWAPTCDSGFTQFTQQGTNN